MFCRSRSSKIRRQKRRPFSMQVGRWSKVSSIKVSKNQKSQVRRVLSWAQPSARRVSPRRRLSHNWPSWQLQGCQGLVRRGEYFSKIEYICTYPKNGPARESSLPWFLDSNISARTPKKAIFLHIVVIFLHGTAIKAFFMHI